MGRRFDLVVGMGGELFTAGSRDIGYHSYVFLVRYRQWCRGFRSGSNALDQSADPRFFRDLVGKSTSWENGVTACPLNILQFTIDGSYE